MSESVTREDWEALQEVLGEAIKRLDGHQAEPVKLGILEFYSTAAMLELEDLAGAAKRFEDFLLQTVAPAWENEAVATLSFSMGALLESMQLHAYGPQFSSKIQEALSYLDYYGDEPDDSDLSAPQEEDAAPVSPAGAEDTREELDAFDSDLLESLLNEVAEREVSESAEGPVSAMEPPKTQAPPAEPVQVSSEPLDEADVGPLPVDDAAISPPPAPPARMREEGAPASRRAPAPQEMPPPPASAQSANPAQATFSPPAVDSGEAVGGVIDTAEWYAEVLRVDPCSEVFVLLAEELCERRQWEEAAAVCREGLSCHPRHTRGRVLLGWALWETGARKEALDILATARRDLEKSAILYKVLAEAAEREGDARSSRELYGIFTSLQGTVGQPRELWVREEPQPVARAQQGPMELTAPSAPALPIAPAVQIEPLAAVAEVDAEPPLVALLAALLRQFQEKPLRTPEDLRLFTASDQGELAGILRRCA